MQVKEKKAEKASTGGMGWHGLMVWSALAEAVVLVLFIVLAGGVIPPVIVGAVLFLIGGLVARRKIRGGAITLAILSALFLLLNAPFIIPSLAVPASTVDFVMTALTVILLVVTLIASIACIRRPVAANSGTARKVGLVAMALVLVSLGTAAAARFAYDAPIAQAGDIKLVAEDFEFSEDQIEVNSGEKVSVFVENSDTALHTFTVEDLDVDLQIPSNSTGRVTFTAPEAGTYEFICVPHESEMKGELTSS